MSFKDSAKKHEPKRGSPILAACEDSFFDGGMHQAALGGLVDELHPRRIRCVFVRILCVGLGCLLGKQADPC